MKRILILALMLIYGATSSGMTVNLHFCCGQLDGISFTGSSHADDCAENGQSDSTECCDDQQLTAKIEGDQQAAPVFKLVKTAEYAHTPAVEYAAEIFPLLSSPHFAYHHYQPTRPAVPLYVQNCVFRL